MHDRQLLYAGRPGVSSLLSVFRGTRCPIADLDQNATRIRYGKVGKSVAKIVPYTGMVPTRDLALADSIYCLTEALAVTNFPNQVS